MTFIRQFRALVGHSFSSNNSLQSIILTSSETLGDFFFRSPEILVFLWTHLTLQPIVAESGRCSDPGNMIISEKLRLKSIERTNTLNTLAIIFAD